MNGMSIDFGTDHRANLEAFAGQLLTAKMVIRNHAYGLENPMRAFLLNDGRVLVSIELELRSMNYLLDNSADFNKWYQNDFLGGAVDPETGRR